MGCCTGPQVLGVNFSHARLEPFSLVLGCEWGSNPAPLRASAAGAPRWYVAPLRAMPQQEYDMSSSAPKPFTLNVSDPDIADLRQRLARTRWPDEPPYEPWSTCASLAYMEELCRYWQSGFDW